MMLGTAVVFVFVAMWYKPKTYMYSYSALIELHSALFVELSVEHVVDPRLIKTEHWVACHVRRG